MITISVDQARKFANYIFKYAWLVVISYLVLAILGFIDTSQNRGVNSMEHGAWGMEHGALGISNI